MEYYNSVCVRVCVSYGPRVYAAPFATRRDELEASQHGATIVFASSWQ
jgi:hypothetical protein